jgi:hypothetical protein
MKIYNVIALILFIMSGNVLIADSGVSHPSPKNDSLIPVSGWPFYLENLEIGTPVSDYGSHFGVKASVDNDGDNYPRFDSPNRIDAKNFLNLAHYATITSFYGQVDQSYIWFEEVSPGSGAHLKPADSRSIQFFPYGWTETASDSSITATGRVMTIATDTFLVHVTLQNKSGSTITLTPVITVLKDSDPQREGTNIPSSSFGQCNTYNIDTINNLISFICDSKRNSKDIKFVRAIKNSEVVNSVNLVTGENYKIDIKFADITLNTGEQKEITFVIGYAAEGDAENDAKNLALEGFTKIQSIGTTTIINNIINDWNTFFNFLPPPHTTDTKYIQLYKMSATALRMNIYKKRNKMSADCSVPGKAHFNFFWAWDTPFHTLGQSEWDVQLAKDNLKTQFSGQVENGMIRMVIDDNLESSFWPDLTQPPVQGWAIKEIAERDNFSDTDWLNSMYEASMKYLNFWETSRDTDGDGLYEFASGLETGWDDTPRFHCGPITNICIVPTVNIDSLDLNSWLYQYYSAMAEIAHKLGREAEADELRQKAEDLVKKMESNLWDNEKGVFFDREFIDGGHEFIRVLTPATFLPLTFGAIRDVEKAKRIIEEHILNPEEFWGTYPIPTVAYNDGKYDHNDDGYYWQGQVWLITAYSALKALYRYGYEQEAEELKKRLLDMMFNADPGGIHETYDALTGRVGWGAGSNGYFGGVGEPSVFQFGWSSAFNMEITLDRYQRERFLMPEDRKISGFVKEITNIKDGKKYIRIESTGYEVPLIILESGSEQPIIDSRSMYLKIEDPYNISESPDATFKVYINFNAKIGEVSSSDGSINWLTTQSDADGNYFNAKLTNETTNITHYIIIPQTEGCGCSAGMEYSSGATLIILVFAIFLCLFLLRFSGLLRKI